jgi:D-tyrosyl-tRNA(Tyr) deacylase
MRAVVQRVSSASVSVGSRVVGRIGSGLLVFVGAEADDRPEDVEYIASKVADMRVFDEGTGDGRSRMNRSVKDVGGSVLLVSQFTLVADCRKGRRPSFDQAAPASLARPLYESVAARLREHGVPVELGEFQAMMQVELTNDGPVTLLLDSRRTF